jgi:hypothetical protein
MQRNLPTRRNGAAAAAVAILGLLSVVSSCAQTKQPAAGSQKSSGAAQPQPSRASSAPAAQGDYYKMKLVKLMDEHGFERPIPAMTLLLPTDWQFQGGIQYGKIGGCNALNLQAVFQATSGDGRLAMELLPKQNWQWSDDPNSQKFMQANNQSGARFGRQPCEVMPPLSAADFLKKMVVPKVRPGATLVAIEPIPDVYQQLQEQAHQAEAQAARAGLKNRIRADVARARLRYTLKGQPVEEWVTAVVVSTGTLAPTYDVRTMRMGQAWSYSCEGQRIFVLRAPQGQLQASEKLFKLILSTLRVDPTWQGRVTQVALNIQAVELKGARDRSAIITKNNQDISKIINEGYQKRQASQDKMAEQFDQVIRGVETYKNPNTGESFELSSQYNHAWMNGANEYILSDNPNFNPNAKLQGNWTELERAKQ